ncbi:E3 ubiquitin-protein ligase MARCHF3-like [Polistes fuscatus]|uniref:E3 ubiquitin-protein ligase MARCHF3-like n=1 Tax=Polistes fuscatus TaxID=30207 RepID=UPI001CAA3104|nr:E3 ubiquitin-protein ligase MARCHF3-like [Polistes fuscatus]
MSIDYDEQLRRKEREQMFADSSLEEIALRTEGNESEKSESKESTKVERRSSEEIWIKDIIENNILILPIEQRKERNDDYYSSSEDICRICHMGGTSLSSNKNQSRSQPEEKQIRISAFSSYSYLGPLISACKCRGTVGLVHADCLERWLTESGHTRCELCGYKYTTKRIPRHSILRSLLIWFKTVVVTRQMFLDVLYLVVTTPLALFACYVCVIALKLLIESGFYQVPWVIVVMLPTCSLTLVAYWAWLMTLGRLHIRRWRRYWRNNFVVRLLPEDINNLANEQSIESTTIDDFYQEVENERMNDRRLIGTSL